MPKVKIPKPGSKPKLPTEETSGYTNAATWQQRFNLARSHQEPLFDKIKKYFDILYTVIDDSEIAPWRSKVYLPLGSTKAWNMIAKFVAQEPGFEVVVRNEDSPEVLALLQEEGIDIEKIADKVQRKLEFDYHNPTLDVPIRAKLYEALVDTVAGGQGFAKVPWVIKSKELRSHPINEFGEVDFTQDEVVKIPLGYNDLEPINIFNFFTAPYSKNVQTAPWHIIREMKTLDDLKAINDEKGIEIYKNLDKLKDVSTTSDSQAQYNASRNRLVSNQDLISADTTVKHIEVFECYERTRKGIEIATFVATANKDGKAWLEIRRQKSPFWHGKYPLVGFYIRKRPHSIWGESIFETVHRLLAAANDTFNHYLDNWNLSVDGMIMIDEQSQIGEYIVGPGEELVYKGEAPKQFRFPEPNPNQVQMIMTEIEKILELATISNYATGTPMSGLDKTQGTATGVSKIMEAASDIIQFMRDNFTQSIKQAGEMWLSNNRQFLTEPFTVMSLKANKLEPIDLTPQELQLQMELRINDLEMQPMSKSERKQNYDQYLAQLLTLQTASVSQYQITQDPSQVLFIDFNQTAEELSKQYGVKRFVKQTIPNEEALAHRQEGEERQADMQEELATDEEADVPDEEVLNEAEAALGEIDGQATEEPTVPLG